MAEDFKSAVTKLNGEAVLADVDDTKEGDSAKKYNTQGVPTLKVFADGQELTEYNGGLDEDSVTKIAQRATLPPYTEIAGAQAGDKFASQNKGKKLLIASELDESAIATSKKATSALCDVIPDTIEFVHGSTSAMKVEGIARGGYLLTSRRARQRGFQGNQV